MPWNQENHPLEEEEEIQSRLRATEERIANVPIRLFNRFQALQKCHRGREGLPMSLKVSNNRGTKSIVPPPMTLIVWNVRVLYSSERQNELRKLCLKRSTEIFGALETKTKIDRFKEATEKMGAEWKIVRNKNDDGRDSIWLEWKPGN